MLQTLIVPFFFDWPTATSQFYISPFLYFFFLRLFLFLLVFFLFSILLYSLNFFIFLLQPLLYYYFSSNDSISANIAANGKNAFKDYCYVVTGNYWFKFASFQIIFSISFRTRTGLYCK